MHMYGFRVKRRNRCSYRAIWTCLHIRIEVRDAERGVWRHLRHDRAAENEIYRRICLRVLGCVTIKPVHCHTRTECDTYVQRRENET